MTDPLQRATSRAPEVLGEGCTQRYDPQALTPEDGTEFAEAAQLWQRLQQGQEPRQEQVDKPAGETLSDESKQ